MTPRQSASALVDLLVLAMLLAIPYLAWKVCS